MTAYIQWANSAASGVRSWAFHGVSKVHILPSGADPAHPIKTLCGRDIRAKASNRWSVSERELGRPDSELCRRCTRKVEMRREAIRRTGRR